MNVAAALENDLAAVSKREKLTVVTKICILLLFSAGGVEQKFFQVFERNDST